MSSKISAALLAPILCLALVQPLCAQTASERVLALFDRFTEDTHRLRPEVATFRGDHRYGDRFSDRSAAGIAADAKYWHSLQTEVRSVDRKVLSRQEGISVEVLQALADYEVAQYGAPGARSMTVSAAPFSFQGSFARMLRVSPVSNETQAGQIIARYHAYGRRVDEEIANMRRWARDGWIPSRPALHEAIRQMDQQLAVTADKSVYFEPFTRLGMGISESTRAALAKQAIEAIDASVLPAVRRLRGFVANEYVPAAPEEGGLGRYPDGDKAYAALVAVATTTTMTPQEIHRIGLEQVAKIRREIAAVMHEAKFEGDFPAFVRYANSDPKFFYSNGKELIEGYREILKRVDPELVRLFAELPRIPYGVRAMPDFLGPGAAESYTQPALDGTTAGWFNANAVGYRIKPKWGMESLALHEGVPGHHLQWARAAELKSLPTFRRAASFTVFNEGWALYAETLGPDLGLYRDPLTRFGFLQNQIWRAARLVIDTGLHAQGWTRQQAIDYMARETGFDESKCTSEVDRYLSWPAQALSYMIGQLKIIELRERANKALGERFDLRRFHNAVLDNGMLPLSILEGVVDDWIAAEVATTSR
jgi:uncharacterized protein (DUF885 family)